MAQLLEMLVQGIRSIGPEQDDAHIIRFLHPLTIISGPNGSGKTTLIEALNYITTDTKPSGQINAFVHSLEVCGRSRVDAQVKLRFLSANGKDVVATKRLNLSRAARGNKLTGKSDEFSLVVTDKHKNKVALSSKVADTKAEILHLLDVPRAILTNVIFCHQENSTWPLSEPKIVKEKFDAIFELTKYVKALEKLRKMAKERTHRLQVLNAELNGLETTVEDKRKKEQELTSLRSRLETFNSKIAGYLEKIQKAEEVRNEVSSELVKLNEFVQQKGMVYAHHQNLRNQLDLVDVPDYPGSEERLLSEIEQIESSAEYKTIEVRRNEIAKGIEQAESERDSILKHRRTLDEKKIQLLSRVEQQTACGNQILEVESSICGSFGLSNSLPIVPQLENLIRLEGEKSRDQKVASQREMEHCDAEKDEVLKEVQRVQFEIKATNEQISKIAGEIVQLQRKLADVSSGERELASLQRQIASLEAERDSLACVDADAVERIRRQRELMQNQLDDVKKACAAAEHLEEAEKDRERKKTEKQQAEQKLDVLMAKHKADFGVVWGGRTPALPLGARIHKMAAQGQQGLDNVEKLHREADKAADGERRAVTQGNQEEERLTKEFVMLRRDIEELCGDSCESNITDRLAEVRIRLKKARLELGPISTKSVLYESWREEAGERSCCPLCDRKFASKMAVRELVDKLTKLQIELPEENERLSREVAALEQKERDLCKAEDKQSQLRKLSEQLRVVSIERKAASSRLAQLEEKLSVLGKDRDDVLAQFQATNRILVDVNMVDNLHESVLQLTGEIASVDAGIRGQSAGRTFLDLKEEKNDMEEKIASLVRAGDRLQKDVSERNRVSENLNRLQSRRLELGESAANAVNIQKQAKDKQREEAELRSAFQKLRDILPDLREREADAVQARRATEKRCREREQKMESGIRVLEQHLRDLDRLYKAHADLGVDAGALNGVSAECAQLDQRAAECARRAEEGRARLGGADDLRSRKRFLEQQRSRMIIFNNIAKSEQELHKLGEWNGETEEVLRKKMQRANSIIEKAGMLKGEQTGEKKEIERNIDQLTKDLNDKRFREADLKIREKMVEKVVAEHTAEDLRNYADRMDGALLEFHRSKMEAVNEVLENLWRKVYHGTDIECIRIRSELSDSKANRSKYDYRVMMVVDTGIEIEMRDRCSAGQKMLASILIRIALSDVFGAQCSILALDEPTTNLDVQKIDDMAEMLVDLIKARSIDDAECEAGRQFQLIVITHDERFVSTLKRHVRPEVIYHVSKSEDGKSKLVREKLDG